MEAVSIAAGVVGAGVAFVGLLWTVVFGPRNLIDMMAKRQDKPEAAAKRSTRAATTATALRNSVRKPEPSGPRKKTFFQNWLAITGRLVIMCWVAPIIAGEGEFDLPTATGGALRVFLVCAPVFLFAGIVITGGEIILRQPANVGPILLLLFLAAFVGEFFILGTIGLIALFLNSLPDDTF